MPTRGKRRSKQKPANLDPAMELTTEQLRTLVVSLRTPNHLDKRIERMEELCRFLRKQKVLLRECMELYPAYDDHFEAFIDLAVEGCFHAEEATTPLDLRSSLRRHALEIESLRAEFKELSANSDLSDSVGELYSGAKVKVKSKSLR